MSAVRLENARPHVMHARQHGLRGGSICGTSGDLPVGETRHGTQLRTTTTAFPPRFRPRSGQGFPPLRGEVIRQRSTRAAPRRFQAGLAIESVASPPRPLRDTSVRATLEDFEALPVVPRRSFDQGGPKLGRASRDVFISPHCMSALGGLFSACSAPVRPSIMGLEGEGEARYKTGEVESKAKGIPHFPQLDHRS